MMRNLPGYKLIGVGILSIGMTTLPVLFAVEPIAAQVQTQPDTTVQTEPNVVERDAGTDDGAWGWLGLLGLIGLAGLAGRGGRRDETPRYTDPADTDVTNRPGSRY